VLTRRWLLAALPAVVAPVALLASAPTAGAASCRVMTVRYSVSGGGLIMLDPDHYDIAYNGCVQFVNQTAADTTITVGDRYSQTLGPSENTTSSTNYTGTTPGRQPVTATSGPAGSSAHGSITVAAPPQPRSSPPKASHQPTRTATPAPAPPPSSSSGTGPQVAPTPARTRRPGHHRGGLQPPVSPPGPVQTQSPTPTPSPEATAVVAGPIEPPTDRGLGLPAALAALAVVGSGAAFIRVLAAEPVDSRETVGGPA
jgi:hypothetical protein